MWKILVTFGSNFVYYSLIISPFGDFFFFGRIVFTVIYFSLSDSFPVRVGV